jgi:glycosyltransferase involved in cell wall biosynthesis
MSSRSRSGAPDDRDTDPAVTVVIPTHNRRELLLRTLDSVMRQTDVTVQVVVVDDGGSDGTPEAVRRSGRAGVRVIRHERSRGVSAARNAGLRMVQTRWVAFVDDDDLWAPTKLRSQLAALRDEEPARWSCVGAVHVDADLRVIFYNRVPTDREVQDNILRRNAVPGGGSGLLVETDLAREVGGFDEQMSILADWDFNLRLSLRSPLAAVDRPLLAYYVHVDSMYHDPAGVVRELLYLEDKHSALPDGRTFQFERGPWYANLARMAHRIGDDRAAGRYLVTSLRYVGTAPMVREVRLQARQALEQRRPRTRRLRTSVQPWTSRYAQGCRQESTDPVALQEKVSRANG